MNRKLIGVLIILGGLIAVIGIIYIVFFHDFSESKEVLEKEQPVAGKEVQEQPSQPAKLPADIINDKGEGRTKISKIEVNKEDLRRMAASFAERFGSYSNHSNYGNIVDLKIFMSKEMQIWADNFINEVRASSDYSDIYYGITTKSILEEVQKFDDDIGRAEILVKTQRRESTGTMSNASAFYQDILITFIRERGAWKVNSAHWQN